jgi:hypothetical protein
LDIERIHKPIVSHIFSLNAYHKSYANAIHTPNADENEIQTFQLTDNINSDNSGNNDYQNNNVIPLYVRRLPGRKAEKEKNSKWS